MAILCERHTTSKIKAFEDLSSIETYGFRGEALASISHIAHLSVTTKTKNSTLAWRAHYLDGRLVPPKPGQPAEPKAVAGRPGTQITVEDLFFNIPTRRKAFRSHAEEYNKIVDMVGRYAVHCKGVGFTCKKAGESSSSLSIQAQTTTSDRIRQIYGSTVGNELIDFEAADERWGFKGHILASNANYHIKKTVFLLFINNRSVESTHLKKALEQTYVNFLPKGGHPFIYISLHIDPARVDVNVHPTKREVHFLNEDEIGEAVCRELQSQLASVDASRTFQTQTLLPGVKPVSDLTDEDKERAPTFTVSGKKRRNSNDLVRTDTYARKITTMFSRAETGESSADNAAPRDEPLALPENIEYETMDDRETTIYKLNSLKELRKEVCQDTHQDLTDIFSTHTFVGIVDETRRLAAMQGGVKLFLVDYGHTCFEYFYQLGLDDFGNFGVIRFSPALDLRFLLRIAAEAEKKALDATDDDFPLDAIVDKVANQLVERREMLQEYFSLEVSPAGQLISIPLMVKGYTPPLAKLPLFLLRLGPNVNWTEEKACFKTFLRELATFYVPEQLPVAPAPRCNTNTNTNNDEGEEAHVPAEIKKRRQHVRWAVENIFFPAFKSKLVATKSLMNGGILEVASLKGLYRVFERC